MKKEHTFVVYPHTAEYFVLPRGARILEVRHGNAKFEVVAEFDVENELHLDPYPLRIIGDTFIIAHHKRM